MKGHVEPPEEIKKYLGEATWYMRDANWKASFPAAARGWFVVFRKRNGEEGGWGNRDVVDS